VEQRRAERVGVQAHPGADLRDPYGVGDELIARVALLVPVVIAGEVECLLDFVAVDDRRHRDRGTAERARSLLRGRVELLDDREQVAEQLLAL